MATLLLLCVAVAVVGCGAPAHDGQLLPAVRDQHPRLLFGPEDVPALQAFAKTERGKQFWSQMEAYLPVSRRPEEPTFLRNATHGQREGFWRLPTVALHYVMTGEQTSYDRSVEYMQLLLDLEHWEEGGETDSGMSAANIMIGAALAYDWLYHDLEPEFRNAFRNKLLLQARRMYAKGHLNEDNGPGYWQADPQNNHRWHRNAGLVLCLLAAAGPDRTDDDELIRKVRRELDFVTRWLPEDGTSHESFSYTIFGMAHLTLALDAADRCLGTESLQIPFIKNLPRFMTQSLTPGRDHRFVFGDQGGNGVGQLAYDVALFKAVGANGLRDHLAVLNDILDRNGAAPTRAWLGLLWYPRDLEPGHADAIPETALFADLGMLITRSGWDAGQAASMFKCGPFGGYTLSAYRATTGRDYVNVAHDDPDANSFLLFNDGAFLTETDRYSKHKQSVNHNTILINGTGQTIAGHGESGTWSQIGGDVTETAVVTAFANNGNNVAIEGEASGFYPANPPDAEPRPALERYRRSFFWIDGRYVLVLDDIRAPEPVEITWLMQGPQLAVSDAADGRYVLEAHNGARCPFQVVSTADATGEIVDSPADHRGKPLGFSQLRRKSRGHSTRVASVYDLWNRGPLTVTLNPIDGEYAVVTVHGSDIADIWDWTPARGRLEPSTIVGLADDGSELLALSRPEPKTRQLIAHVRASDRSLDLAEVAATASDWEQKAQGGWGDFPPANTVDGDASAKSSWRAEGKGQWIQYDLGAPREIDALTIAFMKGNSRRYAFEVLTSPGGETWEKVFAGRSSGATGHAEWFDLEDTTARYLRIVGHGNNHPELGEWININEVAIIVDP
ncbi:MAG: discoidin domain-containing protein [Planctomycetota bacterium]